MATRITLKAKNTVNISMKYTVLQRRHGLWLPINEYYQFRHRECRQLPAGKGYAAKARYECPACLRTYTDLALPDHRCVGGSDSHPKLNNQQYKQNLRWRPTSAYEPLLYKEHE